MDLVYLLLLFSATTFAAIPRNARISNGDSLNIADVPFQVSIQTQDGSHFCGGSLVSTRIVVTAAQCIYDISDPESINVRIGSSDRTEGGTLVAASNFTCHEDFDEETLENDIALIRLSKAVKGIHTADLSLTEFSPGTIALASGWGLDESDYDEPPTTLQGAYSEIISREDCQKEYGDGMISEERICTYSSENQDFGAGDAGGPLSVEGILTGVISTSVRDDVGGVIGIYSSIPEHFEWIRINMGYLLH